MKNYNDIIIIAAFLFISAQLSGQVIIRDSLFLLALIENGVDTNQDGQIQVGEAEAITTLEIESVDISSIDGIEAFSNLNTIKFGKTLIDSADLTNNLQLRSIHLGDNELKEVRLPSLPQLQRLVLRNNEISELDVSSFFDLKELDLENNKISNIDLSSLNKLEDLDLDRNKLSNLDLSGLPNLLKIEVIKNNLDSIDFAYNTKLRNINITDNRISSLDVKHLKDLISLLVVRCPISTLDIAGLENLFTLWINDSSVKTLFMKRTSPDPSQLQFDGAPLKFICADRAYISEVNDELDDENITDCLVSSFCPITDEGVFGGISGRVKIGQSIADCDTSTNYLANPKFETEYLNPSGQHFGVLIGRQDGSYDINFYGRMTLKPARTYANEWQHLVPEFSASNSSSNPQNINQDFCILPVSDKLETEINIIPLQELRAGFESDLILLVRNTGTLPFSGTVALNLPQDSLTFISSDHNPLSIEPGAISWRIQNLLPFNEVNIKTTFRLNSPMDSPPLFGGEGIELCAEITDSVQYQDYICINDFTVNSYDPNDKTYLGKDTITISQVEEVDRLTYLIRFENIGSAEAINVVVSDKLDAAFVSPSSIRILKSSHDVSLEMEEDGAANFIFRDIYLPFEPGFNRGYVLFSVEAITDNIIINDQINNKASIYFDYNFPIITNEASIWIVDEVNTSSTAPDSYLDKMKVFPNPSEGSFTIKSAIRQNLIQKIEWIDASGKVQETDNINLPDFQFNGVDMAPGIYLLRITTDRFVQIHKVVIQKN